MVEETELITMREARSNEKALIRFRNLPFRRSMESRTANPSPSSAASTQPSTDGSSNKPNHPHNNTVGKYDVVYRGKVEDAAFSQVLHASSAKHRENLSADVEYLKFLLTNLLSKYDRSTYISDHKHQCEAFVNQVNHYLLFHEMRNVPLDCRFWYNHFVTGCLKQSYSFTATKQPITWVGGGAFFIPKPTKQICSVLGDTCSTFVSKTVKPKGIRMCRFHRLILAEINGVKYNQVLWITGEEKFAEYFSSIQEIQKQMRAIEKSLIKKTKRFPRGELCNWLDNVDKLSFTFGDGNVPLHFRSKYNHILVNIFGGKGREWHCGGPFTLSESLGKVHWSSIL